MIERVELGKTGINVSRLIYGTEPFALKKGPDGNRTQGDKTPKEGGAILSEALKLGVNFWDTSDDYGTHPHVREGLKLVKRGEVAVSDKSNAATYEEGVKALDFACRDLETDYIDVMFLHIVPPKPFVRLDANSREYVSQDLKGRRGMLKALVEAKESGRIKAVALSTHSTQTLNQVLDYPEIDVVCTVLNKAGAVIDEANLNNHINAIKRLHDDGRFVYVIKLLNAGRFRENASEYIKWALQHNEFIDAWNIGMYSVSDVKKNIALFSEVL